MKGKGNEMDEKLTIWNPGDKINQIKPYRIYEEAKWKSEDVIEEKETPRRREKKMRLDLAKFVRQNGDIVRNVAIMIIAVVIGCIITYWRTSDVLEKRYEMQLKTEVFKAEQNLASRMRDEYGVTEAEAAALQMEEEAKIIAKVLYPMRNNKERGLRSAVWCVLNRVDNPLEMYPDDVYSVCSQKSAFMGWDENNAILDNLYNIALKEVRVWHNGVRPMGTEFVILYWDSREIILRDQIQEHGAHVWTEDDWYDYDEAHGVS